MTRIDFHLNVADHLLYTCRLIRKAYSSGLNIVCYSTQLDVLKQLDTLLWTFSEDDFLPHLLTGHADVAQTPILLTDKAEDIVHYNVLINLDDQWPPFFARFDRLVEIVRPEEPNKVLARERYTFYKERGYPLNTYDKTNG